METGLEIVMIFLIIASTLIIASMVLNTTFSIISEIRNRKAARIEILPCNKTEITIRFSPYSSWKKVTTTETDNWIEKYLQESNENECE